MDREKESIEIKKLVDSYKGAIRQSELSGELFIGGKAKQLGIDKETLKTMILEEVKKEIVHPEKVLHFHRTSFENAQKIINSGALLNRSNMESAGLDTSKLAGSSSKNVQFTKDIYDEEGNPISLGFDTNDLSGNYGANSLEVVFVMGPELINEETYNSSALYPTVEKADLEQCCVTILARDTEMQIKLISQLQEMGINIPVILPENLDRDKILSNLAEKAKITELHKEVEKEIEQYYDDTIGIEYLRPYLIEKLTSIYGKRLEEHGITDISKFLDDDKLAHFNGVESYRELVDEIDSFMDSFDVYTEVGVSEKQDVPIQSDGISPTYDNSEQSEEEKSTLSVPEDKKEDLIEAYEETGISITHINKSKDTISKTKEEQEQSISSKKIGPNIDNPDSHGGR